MTFVIFEINLQNTTFLNFNKIISFEEQNKKIWRKKNLANKSLSSI